ncbi:DNA-binding transcriptional regulator, MarR family [Paenibacillus sp. UNCCL117]|uniref:MarR family winged helix-turn-helix transcriptional regulator n=1 Tax=unclassified Paenibacillus TaxID=185978 RepID=UPI00088ABD7D|nr:MULTISPECIES: MarR family transcriptional regulator [unclassified Paenibacillus]SDD68269.1 DNA-binding transcriptional regulator, MarR family [Paenibacillus sp. cl123]SFW70987.1 DNA-binding transcriptional regulator, MarR family [Paenibacillus sp. UNCCL117]
MDKRDELSKLIGRQMMTMVASYAKLADSRISSSQYFILQALVHEGPLTCSHFAHVLDVTLSAVTNLSNKLVKNGYVERIPSETDRRQVYLRITEQGREMERRLLERYELLTEGLWEEFSGPEVELLIAAYKKMIAHVQKQMRSEQDPHNRQGGVQDGKSGQ